PPAHIRSADSLRRRADRGRHRTRTGRTHATASGGRLPSRSPQSAGDIGTNYHHGRVTAPGHTRAQKKPGACRAFALASQRATAISAKAAVLADNAHRQFQRLLIVQARVDRGLVGAAEVLLAQLTRPTGAFGNVLSSQFEMHAK